MEDYDPQKAIDGLAYFVGQALAALVGENESKQSILAYIVDHHLKQAADPSVSRTMAAVRHGVGKMSTAIRTAKPIPEPRKE
ncbi:hypothetical protein [Acetobacter sp.]|uniref:hypothetical protein n=1 Tax=Acetobacter sp. TaxID=440 RepID=UPI0039E8EAA7